MHLENLSLKGSVFLNTGEEVGSSEKSAIPLKIVFFSTWERQGVCFLPARGVCLHKGTDTLTMSQPGAVR